MSDASSVSHSTSWYLLALPLEPVGPRRCPLGRLHLNKHVEEPRAAGLTHEPVNAPKYRNTTDGALVFAVPIVDAE